ncbi:hypothetical protein ACFUCV_02810 [Specibacter sp. NPDC057265]|uniref:hypothetical protein n=1 Tax=Specibacter sp. NPDC057265 TaxID=3346075 RepID=UPI00363B68C7
MAERGSTKHGPHLDDEMQHETQGMVRGNQPAHAEEWRETEPFPDETDSAEVQNALKRTRTPESGGKEAEQ